MCIEVIYTHRCGHKSSREQPCQQLGTPDYLFCYISQREEDADSSCDECERNCHTLADRSEVYLSACQRCLVPLLKRMQFIFDNRHVTNMTDMAYNTLLGERDVLRAILRRAEIRVIQVPLLMLIRAKFREISLFEHILEHIHNVGYEQPLRAEYECKRQDVERQLASFHEQLSTETQPDAYIAQMLMDCDVDTIFPDSQGLSRY